MKLPTLRTPVTHVIFDLDGLLLDTVPIYNQIMKSIVSRQGYEFTDDLRHRLLGRNRRDCAELIVKHCEHSIDVDECLVALGRKLPRKLPQSQLMPGAERLIRHLHSYGIPMAIGTSSSVSSVALKTMAHKELFSLIHHVTCGTDDPRVSRGKPAPDIFRAAAECFDDASPNIARQCLVFEDALNGVEAARAAGMQVVWVNSELNGSEASNGPATLALRSLLDFKPELFGLPAFD